MLCTVLYFVYYDDKTDQVNVKLMLRNFHLPRYLPSSQMECVHEMVDQKGAVDSPFLEAYVSCKNLQVWVFQKSSSMYIRSIILACVMVR